MEARRSCEPVSNSAVGPAIARATPAWHAALPLEQLCDEVGADRRLVELGKARPEGVGGDGGEAPEQRLGILVAGAGGLAGADAFLGHPLHLVDDDEALQGIQGSPGRLEPRRIDGKIHFFVPTAILAARIPDAV